MVNAWDMMKCLIQSSEYCFRLTSAIILLRWGYPALFTSTSVFFYKKHCNTLFEEQQRILTKYFFAFCWYLLTGSIKFPVLNFVIVDYSFKKKALLLSEKKYNCKRPFAFCSYLHMKSKVSCRSGLQFIKEHSNTHHCIRRFCSSLIFAQDKLCFLF